MKKFKQIIIEEGTVYKPIKADSGFDIPPYGAYVATYPDGIKCWIVDGKYHRTDGPAVLSGDGKEYYWYKYNMLHRIGGPAGVKGNVEKYFIDGNEYTPHEYWSTLKEQGYKIEDNPDAITSLI